MKQLLCDKKYNGIFYAIVIASLFVGISLCVMQFLQGVSWFLFSSLLRTVWGVIILLVGKKIYGRTAKEIISFNGGKAALISGLGFIVYFVYYLADVGSGIKNIAGLTVGLFFSRVILQQVTTGFYEELNYRFLVLEGYFYGKKSIKNKLIYAFLSFVLFGAVHIINGWDTYTFLQTGTIGFAFAVMYIKSRNVLIPMLFHFIYDVFANLTVYMEWNNSQMFLTINSAFEIVLVMMFLMSFVILIKKEKSEILIES